jgi:predicted nucleic acid-binding protein
MEVVFADAFYFIALYSETDEHHQRALQVGLSNFKKLVTTEYVLIEFADALAGTRHRKNADAIIQLLYTDPAFEVVGANTALLQAGLRLYTSRHDKEWSLTDCISFLVMKQRGITEALTHDHHFMVCSPKLVPSDMRVPNRPDGPERTLHERQKAHSGTDHWQVA